MLRDAESGRDVPVGARGAARIEVVGGGEALTRLRVLVVADLLRRIVDTSGSRVLVAADDRVAGRDALGIAPADADPGTFPSPDVVIAVGPPWPDNDAVRLAVGALTLNGSPDVPDLATPGVAADGTGGAGGDVWDPLALRLAILRMPAGRAADLGGGDVREAGDELARWRKEVAGWAESPSHPVSEEVVAAFRGALDGDLDTAGALAVLRELEDDPGTPPGSKFETFVFADRILALELPREIGHT